MTDKLKKTLEQVRDLLDPDHMSEQMCDTLYNNVNELIDSLEGYTLIKTELFDKAIVAAVYDNEWNDNAGVYQCRDCSMSAEYCSNIEHTDSCLVTILKATKDSK